MHSPTTEEIRLRRVLTNAKLVILLDRQAIHGYCVRSLGENDKLEQEEVPNCNQYRHTSLSNCNAEIDTIYQ